MSGLEKATCGCPPMGGSSHNGRRVNLVLPDATGCLTCGQPYVPVVDWMETTWSPHNEVLRTLHGTLDKRLNKVAFDLWLDKTMPSDVDVMDLKKIRDALEKAGVGETGDWTAYIPRWQEVLEEIHSVLTCPDCGLEHDMKEDE